jgi:predicted Zn-ribbon and HTH transcriptional regulator
MSAQRLTEDFYRQANRIVLDALRRNIVVFPDDIGERKGFSFRKIPAVCNKCGIDYEKNVTIQKFCQPCGEIESRERYYKRKQKRLDAKAKAKEKATV